MIEGCSICQKPTVVDDRAFICGDCWRRKDLAIAVDHPFGDKIATIIGVAVQLLIDENKGSDEPDPYVAVLENLMARLSAR